MCIVTFAWQIVIIIFSVTTCELIMNIHKIHWTGFSTGKSTGIRTGFQLVNQLVIIYWFSTGKATGKSTGNINWCQMSTGISTGFQIVSTGFNWYQLRPVDTSWDQFKPVDTSWKSLLVSTGINWNFDLGNRWPLHSHPLPSRTEKGLAIDAPVYHYIFSLHGFFLRVLTDRQLVVNRKHP